MKNIFLLFYCVLIFVFNIACSSKFQSKYKATDKEECKEFFDFLRKEFFRDEKNILRTTQQCFWLPKFQRTSFDTIITKRFRNIMYYGEKKTSHCDYILKVTDFYAVLGKPDFIGIQPTYKYSYCIYFISDTHTGDCPCGEVGLDGNFHFKHKRGYSPAYYCHRLHIRFRPEDNSVFSVDLY